MYQQKVTNRQPNALQGLLIVLGVAAAAVGGSMAFERLTVRFGALASAGFILYGIAIAWFLLYWFVLGFIYTATDDCLRVCRFYGKRERFMADVWLNKVQAYGTPEELRQRFPEARVSRATKAQCPLEPFALAYKQDGRTDILVLQPDETLRQKLIEAVKKYL